MSEVDRGCAEQQGKSAPRAGPCVQAAVFARRGEYWTVGIGGETNLLKDVKGLSYIQRLLQHPGQEFHALDLSNQPATAGPESGSASSLASEHSLTIGGLGDAGEMLDVLARQNYRRRIAELRKELEELRERGDNGRAAKVESEVDYLAREIARAVGLGGRARRAGSAAERARIRVTSAIKGAMQKISERDASLGDFLSRTVRTGSFCSYVPDSPNPVAWGFSPDGLDRAAEPKGAPPFFSRHAAVFLSANRNCTSFVGREAECAILGRSLGQALRRRGRLVMIGGAPGIGKSRTAAEFAAGASRRGVLTLAGNCYDCDDSVPFEPFVEVLEAMLAQAPSRQAFREMLGTAAPELSRLMPQLRRWFPDIPAAPELAPELGRRMLFSSMAELFGRVAENRPLLLLLEDLQWAKEGTLSLLSFLARAISNLPMMIIGTYRDTDLDPASALVRTLDELMRLPIVERIGLSGLPQSAVSQMLRALSPWELPETAVEFVHSNTEGNPFFVEELFRHLAERGKLADSAGRFALARALSEADVPQSLRLIIGRRLAELSDGARRVLNLAAVIGRSFTFDLLEASTRMDSERLLDGLEEVEGAGLISSSVQYPEARFRFSHELLRKAVLGDLSAARRRRFHLDVADAMERLYPDRLEDHANDLAFHLWQAGNASDAGRTIGYLAMAARREREQGACDAALGRLKNALELLAGLPHTAARDRRELSLLNDLALAAMAAKGYAAPEVATAYGRGRELCRRVGDSSERFRTLLGLCAFFFVQGDFRAARETAEQALAQARIRADPEFLMRANHVMGCALLYCGEICAARAHLEAGLRLCDPKALGEPTIPYEQDPGIAMRAFLGWALFLLGYPDQALKAAKEALTLAKALSHPMSEAFALSHLVRVHLFRREWPIAHSLAATLIALATDQGLPLFVIGGRMLQTWALAELGRGEEAVRRIRQDWPSWQGTGAGLESLAIVATARVYGESGRIKAALQTIESLTPLTMASGDRLHDAELSRLKGELLLRSGDNLGDSASAERGFLSAIEIARRQQARSAELRASISLARLWRSTGDAGRARQLLSQIYGWFGEGFDTPDLREARSMLAELC